MVSGFQFPPVGFGPGSQPLAEDDTLAYVALPSGMRTYTPHLPDVGDVADIAPALDLLAALAEGCDRAVATGRSADFDLAALDPAARKLIAETLGQGEVSIRAHGVPALAIQEAVFTGVWMLSGAGVDRVQVAPVPDVARARAFNPRRPAVGAVAPRTPEVVNAPAILSELSEKSAQWVPGTGPHVVNLTLLPHTEADLVWLAEALGEGSVTILSRGYGNCRIAATGMPHVWRVQFFNSMDTLILDTFEVTGMPEVALAAPEDLTDSAVRIREVIEAIR